MAARTRSVASVSLEIENGLTVPSREGVHVTEDEFPGAVAVEAGDVLFANDGAGRAAAEKDAVQRPLLRQRQVLFQIAQQRVDMAALRQPTFQRVRVEVAVWALANAPRRVDVQRER